MLAKLIKYDLKYLLKSVALFGGLLLICAILFNITGYHEIIEPGNDAWLGYNRPSMIIFLHTIFYNAIFVVVIWLILNSIMRIWHRYRASFFLDESYLTHTLPIKRSTLWLAKFLSTVITLLSVLAAIAFSFAVLSLSPNGKDLIASFGIFPHKPNPFYIVSYIITFFTQLLCATMCGLLGITLGNRAQNHRLRKSIFFGTAFYILCGLTLIWGLLLLNFIPDFRAMIVDLDVNLSTPYAFDPILMIKLLSIVFIIYSALIATIYFSNRALLQKGIDVD